MQESTSFLFLNDLDNQPLFLEKPVRRIVARKGEDVLSALLQIDQAIQDQKYYLAGYISYETGYILMGLRPPEQRSLTQQALIDFYVFESKSPEPKSYNSPACFYEFQPPQDFEVYAEALQKIHQELKQGNSYQANYTFRSQCESFGDSRTLFNKLYQVQMSRYAAHAICSDVEILSLSPELFFSKIKQRITTKPMKGTLPIGNRVLSEDHEKKLRAENLMIVDLLRNDLTKVARPESIRVESLMQRETYRTLQQIVSTIVGDVDTSVTFSQLIMALFPCGSITGAPKYKTMEILGNLEDTVRGIYTGTIGFITPRGDMQFNVAIRTLVREKSSWVYGIGGGIVLGSEVASEYEEALLKSQFIRKANSDFYLFETLLCKEGQLQEFDAHLKRLLKSANTFGFSCDIDSIRKQLEIRCKDIAGSARVQLQLHGDGRCNMQCTPLNAPKVPLRIMISKIKMDSKNIFLQHKTSNRQVYEEEFLLCRHKDYYDVIFENERDELTECSRHNVFLKFGNQWFTPPLESGVLAGVQREQFMMEHAAKEKVLFKKDLLAADEVWLTNSLRGNVRVEVVE